ncbi:MAG: amidohydrolase family protein [Bryobacterales bacterium]
MISRIVLSLAFAALLSAQTFSASAFRPPRTREVMYYNGKIITMDPEQPVAEALTLADGRILAVGTTQQVGRTIGPATKQINLNGRTVVPGLIDSHVHPIGAALAEMDGEIPVMGSFAELKAHVEQEMRKNPGNALIFVPKVYSTPSLSGATPRARRSTPGPATAP